MINASRSEGKGKRRKKKKAAKETNDTNELKETPGRESDDGRPVIPHPATYFATHGLAWDAEGAGLVAERDFLQTAPIDAATRECLARWGLGHGEDATTRTPTAAAADAAETLSQSHGPAREPGLESVRESGREYNPNPFLELYRARWREGLRHWWCSGWAKHRGVTTPSAARLRPHEGMPPELYKHQVCVHIPTISFGSSNKANKILCASASTGHLANCRVLSFATDPLVIRRPSSTVKVSE